MAQNKWKSKGKQDTKRMWWKHQAPPSADITLMDENEKVVLLVHGYIREIGEAIQTKHIIPADIRETVRLYSWTLPMHSIQCIAATHLVSTEIDKYVNNEENQCEFSGNKDLNILKFIYVRGGALRDCYLLRDIKDIDLVINIHELSIEYLNHLKTYHSESDQQSKDIKCIFLRHYRNKYKSIYNNTMHDKLKTTWFPNQHKISEPIDENVDKLWNFENFIVNCDYLLNARFVINILYHSQLSRHFKIESKYFGHHYECKLKSFVYQGMKLENIMFDIVDQTGYTYGRYQTFKVFKTLNGTENVAKMLSDIDAFNEQYDDDGEYEEDEEEEDDDEEEEEEEVDVKDISIPIYPFPMNVVYYGFTINSIHIDLYNVLNVGVIENGIDFNWENKLNKKYGNEIVNKYNNIGVHDIKMKILQCPSLDVINAVTANFYFWRLVKTAQKFINKIENGVWKIDEKYLQHTIKHYGLWFNDEFIERSPTVLRMKFINKFFKWGISDKEKDYVDRLHVFRYIKFEKVFKQKLNKYPNKLKLRFEKKMQSFSIKQRRAIKACFTEFGYPKINCYV